MASEKFIKRGYVKWTDDDGVFHKEPLHEHADLLAAATPEQQIQAEEVKRGIAAGEKFFADREAEGSDDAKQTLEALKAAPADILSTSQLVATTDDEGKPIIVEASAVDSSPAIPVNQEAPAESNGATPVPQEQAVTTESTVDHHDDTDSGHPAA